MLAWLTVWLPLENVSAMREELGLSTVSSQGQARCPGQTRKPIRSVLVGRASQSERCSCPVRLNYGLLRPPATACLRFSHTVPPSRLPLCHPPTHPRTSDPALSHQGDRGSEKGPPSKAQAARTLGVRLQPTAESLRTNCKKTEGSLHSHHRMGDTVWAFTPKSHKAGVPRHRSNHLAFVPVTSEAP